MTNEMILLLVLLVLTMGLLPAWPYSSAWGYRPSGILMLLLLIFFIWILADHRSLCRSTRQDTKTTAQDVGARIKATGRDVADSIRRAVQ